jgi:hypothetical protein
MLSEDDVGRAAGALLCVLYSVFVASIVVQWEFRRALGPSRLKRLEHLRMFVEPRTKKGKHLQEAMRELLLETDRGYVIKGAKPSRLVLIPWRIT